MQLCVSDAFIRSQDKTFNLVCGPGALFPRGKVVWAWHSPPSTAEVGSAWSCPSPAPYTFMACAERPLPLPSLTSTDHIKKKNIVLLCPSMYSETCPKRTCKGLQFSFLCRKVPFNIGTLVLVTVTPDLPDCSIFIVQTGFLYGRFPFKTDITVVRPHVTEWISIE